MDKIEPVKSLNCVNNWCKYKDGFYCHSTCGSYVTYGTKFIELKSRIHADYVYVFDIKTGKEIAFGYLNEVFSDCLEFQNREVREAGYQTGTTFVVGLGKEV